MSVVRQGVHAVIAVVVVTALVAGVVLLVENADGAFNGDYQVVASFPSAGQGLHTGSEVDYRGVEVGTVTSIGLSGGRARVVLANESLCALSRQNRFRHPKPPNFAQTRINLHTAPKRQKR